ncbi:hypothetical protein [uncultured Microscilla sp.]|uniref:hypothetical protein n=1 Tax=uncultured Microscilla sp. TaxID=432653 RepID=UPI0026095D28|nr:hypothetical protein [uncultured Microscilla sp.]
MMKKTILLFISLLIAGAQLDAQAQKIGEIKDKSEKSGNRSNRSSSGSSGGGCGDAGAGCAGDALGSMCSSIGSTVCSSFINEILANSFARRNAETGGTYVPISFEIGGDATFVPSTESLYRPRARFRVGFLSFDYRYTYLTETVLGNRTSFPTHEIQLLQINPIIDPAYDFRIGWGLYHEQDSNSPNPTFSELTAGFDAFPTRMKLGTEFRYVIARNSTVGSPRWEINAQAKYALVDNPSTKIYFGFSGSYAEYYTISIWGIGLGLSFKFGSL